MLISTLPVPLSHDRISRYPGIAHNTNHHFYQRYYYQKHYFETTITRKYLALCPTVLLQCDFEQLSNSHHYILLSLLKYGWSSFKKLKTSLEASSKGAEHRNWKFNISKLQFYAISPHDSFWQNVLNDLQQMAFTNIFWHKECEKKEDNATLF